ncbi:hypothetical protein ISF_07785 [Cordyceps fumosorosea ARSEF 2679]|uniref:Uncharacterized protein n=1 Tax=Cordyceps fumosorosea (strain ARSEF 2679) TaxID=1081104 RepID=A0A162MG77_CORFA|nr:hypothetical protein ISF_07785 [Cordyceps fumosorosea ARSEF 2679]OAA55680.1 hypothetical protein ISF_07785 [Cordyceps fumosorosea ARSEF 2679]
MASAPSPLSIIIESTSSSTESWDSDKMHPSPLASHPFRIPTPSFTDLDIPSDLQYASRPVSDMNVAGTRTSYLGGDLHDSTNHGENIRRPRSRNDVAALIEFLRTHEPPPDNFMSQPYSAEEEERGRWGKIKVMGKKRSKSMSRAPAPFRLPDSAVAGLTTGGHRHIAISIPINASHFSDDTKSQYPILNAHVEPPVPPVPESVRTFKNKNGVVTVLRPLSTGQHYSSLPPSPASPRRFDRDYPPQLLRNRRMMPPSPPPSSPADSEHWPLAQTEPDASSYAHERTGSHNSSELVRSNSSSHQNAEFVRAAYPTRGSSMAASPRMKHHHTSSIDEVIAEEEPYPRNPSPMPRDGAMRRNTERRTGHPPVSLTTSLASRRSNSSLRCEWQADNETVTGQPKVVQVKESPVIDRAPSPPASVRSIKSRRERVREKKLRDIAAARNSEAGKVSSPTGPEGAEESVAPVTDQPVPTVSAQPGPKLSTIMVVVDMHPGDEAANKEPATRATTDDAESVIEVPASSAITLPTPPTSTETSPAQKHGFDTRTALTRRREWQSARETERKQRDAGAGAKTSQQARPLGGVAVTDPEREILHLYEAYREQRLRDMESRVRRLERNGDLWLRALMPMLEDVRGSSTVPITAAALDDEGMRDWASDDETAAASNNAGSIDRLARASQRRRLIRRASLSRERMLEELMRREERDLRAQHQHPDVSGMSAIEPLMRELAAGGAPPETAPSQTTTAPRARGDVPLPLRPRPASHRGVWV